MLKLIFFGLLIKEYRMCASATQINAAAYASTETRPAMKDAGTRHDAVSAGSQGRFMLGKSEDGRLNCLVTFDLKCDLGDAFPNPGVLPRGNSAALS
jgi:hypothetical protein